MASVQIKVTAEAASSRSRILWGTTGQGVRNGSPVGTCLSACLSISLSHGKKSRNLKENVGLERSRVT